MDKRKITALAVLPIMLTLLAGCGKGDKVMVFDYPRYVDSAGQVVTVKPIKKHENVGYTVDVISWQIFTMDSVLQYGHAGFSEGEGFGTDWFSVKKTGNVMEIALMENESPDQERQIDISYVPHSGDFCPYGITVTQQHLHSQSQQ